jgi:hypothetical protein
MKENTHEHNEEQERLLKYALAIRCIESGKTPLLIGGSPATLCQNIEFQDVEYTNNAEKRIAMLRPGQTIDFSDHNDKRVYCMETQRAQTGYCKETIVDASIEFEDPNNPNPYGGGTAIVETEHFIISTIDFSQEHAELAFGGQEFSDGIQWLSELWEKFANQPQQDVDSGIKHELASICYHHGIPAIHMVDTIEVNRFDTSFRDTIFDLRDLDVGDNIWIHGNSRNMATLAQSDVGSSISIEEIAAIYVAGDEETPLYIIIDQDGVLYSTIDFSEELAQIRREGFENIRTYGDIPVKATIESPAIDDPNIEGLDDGPIIS